MAVRQAKNKDGHIKPGWWEIDYRPFGKKGPRIIRQYQMTEAEAVTLEAELRRISRQAPLPVNPRINDVMPDWIDDYSNNHLPNTVRDMKNCLTKLLPFWGHLYFAEVSPANVELYKKQRVEAGVTKRTTNKELTYLSSFLKWSHEHEHCGPPLKIKKFPAKQTRPKRPRIPRREDIEGLLKAIEPQYYPIVLLLYDAGLRREEALQLKREEVDTRAGLLFITGKGNKQRTMPITTDRLQRALEEAIGKVKMGYLFVNPKTKKPWYSIRKALNRAAEVAGIDQRVYHHLLRHSFGTHSLAAGVSLRAVQGFMGHSTSQVTETYTHLLDDYLAAEAAKINRAVKRITTVESGGGPKGKKPKRNPD